MKVRALGKLSGAVGERAKGEEFTVDAKTGAGLVLRGLVEEVSEPAASEKPKEKPAKE